MREYVEDCFGVSMYAPGDLKRIEERLCSGTHWDSILHFTRGEMKPLDRNNREAIVQRSSAKRQSELNRKYFTDDIVRNRLTIARLAEKIRNCMLVHLDDARIKSRAGALAPEKVWRGVALGDESVFTRPERGNDKMCIRDRSSAPSLRTASIARRVPRKPFSSGRGCPPSQQIRLGISDVYKRQAHFSV